MKYTVKKIKTKRSYTIDDMALLFGVDRKTCSRWIKVEGLAVIQEKVRPLLVDGATLKQFMLNRNKKKSVKLKADEFYCLKCREPRTAYPDSIETIKTGRIGKRSGKEQIKMIGKCSECGIKLHRFIKSLKKTI